MRLYQEEFASELSKVMNDMNLNGLPVEEAMKRIRAIMEKYKREEAAYRKRMWLILISFFSAVIIILWLLYQFIDWII